MRRASTFFLALLCLTPVAKHLYAQTCIPITVVANCQTGITETFNADATIGSSGFSSTNFSLQSGNGQNAGDKFLQSTTVSAGTTKTLLSNTFIAPAVNGTINLRFDLAGTDATVTNLEIFARTTSNDILLCSGGTVNTAGVNCYSFITPLALAGQAFRFFFRFTISGQNPRLVVFDDFGTNVGASSTVLPVTFTNVESKKVSTGVQLTWKVTGESGGGIYNIERSITGRDFSTIGLVNFTSQSSYTFTDASPSDNAFYRIKSTYTNGKYQYSPTLRVSSEKSTIVLSAFPQPAQNNVTINHGAVKAGSQITVSSEDGRMVQRVSPAEGTTQTILNLTSLKAGLYLVRLKNSDGNTETIKVLKQ